MSLTVKQITDLGTTQLKNAGVMDADRDADTLYCYMVGIPESKMITEYQYTLQEILCDKYFALIDRRAAGEPLQYIVGSAAFMGLPFKVDPTVLIPRQDTETLVEYALSIINDDKLDGPSLGLERKSWDVLDMGTGSGAISVSIAKLGKNCNVTATDISKEALAIAKENANQNGVGRDIKFLQGSYFEPVSGRFSTKKFDMIISNPPYIPTDVIEELQVEIRDHEPRVALDGGADGLDAYRIIAKNADKHLKKNGVLMLEIGHDQREAVTTMLENMGVFKDIRCYKDLPGRDRVIFARAE